jgi:hypothetical protein
LRSGGPPLLQGAVINLPSWVEVKRHANVVLETLVV